jgi:hypothetical protein
MSSLPQRAQSAVKDRVIPVIGRSGDLEVENLNSEPKGLKAKS